MKVIVICICIISCLASTAQTIKTYTGQYESIQPNTIHQYGIATYTYKDTGNGRLYHGNFSYSDKSNSLKGKFVDDKQDGVWTLTEKTNFNSRKKYYNGKRIISVTYKNGVPDGTFSIVLVDNNNITRAYVKSKIMGDKIVGSVSADLNTSLFDFWGHNFSSSFDTPYLNKINGSFNDDGEPVGIWKVYNPTIEISEQYLSDGSIVVSSYNPSTGDAITDNRPAYMPNMIIEAANFALRTTTMRSTEKIQISLIDFSESDTEQVRKDKEEALKRIRNIFIGK